jgi:hypothetical protein
MEQPLVLSPLECGTPLSFYSYSTIEVIFYNNELH